MQALVPETRIPIQLFLPIFTTHEIQAWEQEERKRIEHKNKRHAEYLSRTYKFVVDTSSDDLFERIDDSVLDMPLIGPSEGNELNIDQSQKCDEKEFQAEVFDEGDKEEWTDAAADQLHEAVLHYSLKALQARGNGAEKKEILRWIFKPDVMFAKISTPSGAVKEVALRQNETPFSFVRCCNICGLRHEKLMEDLTPIIAEIGLEKDFKELFNGSK